MLKRLIEVALPLKQVSEQSAREKSIRHGHISTLHIWWARRPLAACRAVVFASLIPDPDDPECPKSFHKLVMEVLGRSESKPKVLEPSPAAPATVGAVPLEDTPRNRCLEFIKHLVRWENSNNPEYIEPARTLIAAAHKFLHPGTEGDAPKVLDPFTGGGSIPLEALRLGCEAHAIDLNPVARLIELCTLVYPQTYAQPNSRRVPDYIQRTVGRTTAKKKGKGLPTLFDGSDDVAVTGDRIIPEIEITEAEYRKNPLLADYKYWSLYTLERAWREVWDSYSPSSTGPRASAYLWARTTRCPNPVCGSLIPLIQSKLVSSKKNRSILLGYICKSDGIVFDLTVEENTREDQTAGTLGRNSVMCPNCQTVIKKSDLESIGIKVGFGHELTCVVESSPRGKTYRPPQQDDLGRYAKAAKRLNRLASEEEGQRHSIPNVELPYLRSILTCVFMELINGINDSISVSYYALLPL